VSEPIPCQESEEEDLEQATDEENISFRGGADGEASNTQTSGFEEASAETRTILSLKSAHSETLNRRARQVRSDLEPEDDTIFAQNQHELFVGKQRLVVLEKADVNFSSPMHTEQTKSLGSETAQPKPPVLDLQVRHKTISIRQVVNSH